LVARDRILIEATPTGPYARLSVQRVPDLKPVYHEARKTGRSGDISAQGRR